MFRHTVNILNRLYNYCSTILFETIKNTAKYLSFSVKFMIHFKHGFAVKFVTV